MCCHSRLRVLRGDFCFLGSSVISGILMFFALFFLKIAEQSIISDASQALRVTGFLVLFLCILVALGFALMLGGVISTAKGIRNAIQQVIKRTPLHKTSNKFPEEKASEYSYNVDEFIESVLQPLYGFFGAIVVVILLIICFLYFHPNVAVFPVLSAFISVMLFVKILPYKCEENQCFSVFLNSAIIQCAKKFIVCLSKTIKQFIVFIMCLLETIIQLIGLILQLLGTIIKPIEILDQAIRGVAERKRRAIQNIKKIFTEYTLQNLKEDMVQAAKKTVVEYGGIVCKFLPILATLLLVSFEVLALKSLVVGIILFSCIADGLSKIAKVYCSFPKIKKHIKDLRKITGCAKRDSESEWAYLFRLLFGTAQFYKQKD